MTIQTVVGSSAVGQELHLARVAADLKGAEYDPEAFNGPILRFARPAATALIFRTGDIIWTGTDSPDAAHEGFEILLERLESLGIRVDSGKRLDRSVNSSS